MDLKKRCFQQKKKMYMFFITFSIMYLSVFLFTNLSSTSYSYKRIYSSLKNHSCPLSPANSGCPIFSAESINKSIAKYLSAFIYSLYKFPVRAPSASTPSTRFVLELIRIPKSSFFFVMNFCLNHLIFVLLEVLCQVLFLYR